MNIGLEVSFGVVPLKRFGKEWKLFVILHKHSNHWGFPKGRAEFNETPTQSAMRELLEETGFSVQKFLTNNPITESYCFYRKEKKIEKIVHYFPALVLGEFVPQLSEVCEGRWLSFPQAYQLLTFKEAKSLCNQVKTLTEIQ